MENSSKTFRDTLALQIKGKLEERSHQLEQAKMSVFSDKLKEMMKLEIMEIFKKEIDGIRKTQWYDRARQAHLEVNRAKRNFNKANLEREILMQEYIEKLKEADKNIAESKEIYEKAEMEYRWEIQDSNIDKWDILDDNSNVENNLPNGESLEKIDEIEEIQESNSNTDELIQENNDKINDVNEDEIWNTEVKIENFEDNNSNLNGTPFKDDSDFFGIKNELIWDEEAIKEDLRNYVTIEKCMDKTWYFGRKITINIPKVWTRFSGYNFECFVSDESFKNVYWLEEARGRFLYRDDLYRLLEAINSYMNIYWITRDKYGYDKDMLWRIDNCVWIECFKYLTWLDSLYWLGRDFTEYKLNCTGKKQIFTNRNKRAHLLLIPSK